MSTQTAHKSSAGKKFLTGLLAWVAVIAFAYIAITAVQMGEVNIGIGFGVASLIALLIAPPKGKKGARSGH